MKKLLFVGVMQAVLLAGAQSAKVVFDLSHGQFQDVFVNPSYYDYVMPAYQEICREIGAEYAEARDGLSREVLRGAKALVMISPLARSTQKPIQDAEKQAVVDFIRGGGSVLMFVDEEEYRVILKEYGANDITMPFGIEIGDDITSVPGNCGAISFENEIFGGRREVPYSGSRVIRGGIPASVCMEGGWVHGAYVKAQGGGKLFVAGETMVALLMGLPDGERNVHKMMETRWWGKDSRLYMKELLIWATAPTEKHKEAQEMEDLEKRIVRLSVVTVVPEKLDEYLSFATECGRVSMATEPGVLMMYSMSGKEQPNRITILEIYADQAAYESHIKTSHFRKYKQGTLDMVQKLELLDQKALVPEMRMK